CQSFDYHTCLPSLFFLFTDTAPTQIYTLSLHDALPIYRLAGGPVQVRRGDPARRAALLVPHGRRHDGEPLAAHRPARRQARRRRSEEHTSELQSRGHLVCRLLLEKKNMGAAPCTCVPRF